MRIGPVCIAHPVTLAPMEEHTNHPVRLLMKQFGASLVCTERVDALDVARRDRRALRILHTTSQETPRAGQISGADPVTMAAAARVVEEQGFDIVDLNFECPIRRLLNRGEGGALLADPPAIERIVEAVRRAGSIPLTLKTRSAPGTEPETVADGARPAAQAGRGREMLRVVEEEFQFYGTTVGLRRLARTSCYFAKFVPRFADFRDAIHQVQALEEFRRLVREHFR